MIVAGDIGAMHPKLRFETQGSRKKLPRKVRFALPEDSDSVIELPSNSNYNPGFDYGEASGERMEFGELDPGSIAFFSAVASGDVGRAKKLFDLGININVQMLDGRTPLHVAAEVGDLRMVQFLIANKATIDAVTPAGKTLLKDLKRPIAAKIIESIANDLRERVIRAGMLQVIKHAKRQENQSVVHLLEKYLDLNFLEGLVRKQTMLPKRIESSEKEKIYSDYYGSE